METGIFIFVFELPSLRSKQKQNHVLCLEQHVVDPLLNSLKGSEPKTKEQQKTPKPFPFYLLMKVSIQLKRWRNLYKQTFKKKNLCVLGNDF